MPECPPISGIDRDGPISCAARFQGTPQWGYGENVPGPWLKHRFEHKPTDTVSDMPDEGRRAKGDGAQRGGEQCDTAIGREGR